MVLEDYLSTCQFEVEPLLQSDENWTCAPAYLPCDSPLGSTPHHSVNNHVFIGQSDSNNDGAPRNLPIIPADGAFRLDFHLTREKSDSATRLLSDNGLVESEIVVSALADEIGAVGYSVDILSVKVVGDSVVVRTQVIFSSRMTLRDLLKANEQLHMWNSLKNNDPSYATRIVQVQRVMDEEHGYEVLENSFGARYNTFESAPRTTQLQNIGLGAAALVVGAVLGTVVAAYIKKKRSRIWDQINPHLLHHGPVTTNPVLTRSRKSVFSKEPMKM